jgi:ABC-type amino acid transport substrate-binding protein
MFMSSPTARKVRLGLALSALLFGSAMHAQAQTAVAGTLKVAMEISYPPFESYDGDKIVGFDPELSTMLAREMKLKPVFADTKFASLVLVWAAVNMTPLSRPSTSHPSAPRSPMPFPTPAAVHSSW